MKRILLVLVFFLCIHINAFTQDNTHSIPAIINELNVYLKSVDFEKKLKDDKNIFKF